MVRLILVEGEELGLTPGAIADGLTPALHAILTKFHGRPFPEDGAVLVGMEMANFLYPYERWEDAFDVLPPPTPRNIAKVLEGVLRLRRLAGLIRPRGPEAPTFLSEILDQLPAIQALGTLTGEIATIAECVAQNPVDMVNLVRDNPYIRAHNLYGPIAQMATYLSPRTLQFVEPERFDRSQVAHDPDPRTPYFVLAWVAVSMDYRVLSYVDYRYIGTDTYIELVYHSVRNTGLTLGYIPYFEGLPVAKLATMAIKENGMAFQYVGKIRPLLPPRMIPKLAALAVANNGMALQFVDNADMDEETYDKIVAAALRQNRMAATYVRNQRRPTVAEREWWRIRQSLQDPNGLEDALL